MKKIEKSIFWFLKEICFLLIFVKSVNLFCMEEIKEIENSDQPSINNNKFDNLNKLISLSKLHFKGILNEGRVKSIKGCWKDTIFITIFLGVLMAYTFSLYNIFNSSTNFNKNISGITVGAFSGFIGAIGIKKSLRSFNNEVIKLIEENKIKDNNFFKEGEDFKKLIKKEGYKEDLVIIKPEKIFFSLGEYDEKDFSINNKEENGFWPIISNYISYFFDVSDKQIIKKINEIKNNNIYRFCSEDNKYGGVLLKGEKLNFPDEPNSSLDYIEKSLINKKINDLVLNDPDILEYIIGETNKKIIEESSFHKNLFKKTFQRFFSKKDSKVNIASLFLYKNIIDFSQNKEIISKLWEDGFIIKIIEGNDENDEKENKKQIENIKNEIFILLDKNKRELFYLIRDAIKRVKDQGDGDNRIEKYIFNTEEDDKQEANGKDWCNESFENVKNIKKEYLETKERDKALNILNSDIKIYLEYIKSIDEKKKKIKVKEDCVGFDKKGEEELINNIKKLNNQIVEIQNIYLNVEEQKNMMNKELIKKLDQDLKEIFSNVKKIITNAEKEKSKNPFDQFGGQQNLN